MHTPESPESPPRGHKPTQPQVLASTWPMRQHYHVILKQLTSCSEDIADLLCFFIAFLEIFLDQTM